MTIDLDIRAALHAPAASPRDAVGAVARPATTMPGGLTTSIVVPARNEAPNLAVLVREIAAAMKGRVFEVVVVDDGSTDETADTLAALLGDGIPVRHLRHDRSAGQSAAVRTGVFAALGQFVVTIDGDGQNDPAFIPAMIDALAAAGPRVGIVAGQRRARTDTLVKRLSSRFANGLRSAILKDGTRDTGCGLKAIRTDLFRTLPFFDGWHRYLPALALMEGHGVLHIDVVDRPRRFGTSNYGVLDRARRGALDLVGVWWLRRRRRVRPGVSELTTGATR
jgi:glycosyltransferase involved in cell wall biosynthesis